MFNIILILVLSLLIFFANSYLNAKKDGTLQTYTKYIEAKKLFEDNDFLACEEKLIEILQDFPNHLKALLLLLSLYKLIDRKKALPDVYVRILELPSSTKKDIDSKEFRRDLADICYELNQFDDAFEHYLHLLSDEPDIESLYRLAFLYASQAKYDQAKGLYETVLAKESTHVEATRGLILCFLGLGNFSEAKDFLLDLVNDNDYKSYELYLLARSYDLEENFEVSNKFFAKYFEESSTDHNLFLRDAYDYVLQFLYDFDHIETGYLHEQWVSYIRKYLESFECSFEIKQELFWLLGWAYFFSDEKRSKISKSIDMWNNVSQLDPEFKNVATLLKKAKISNFRTIKSLESFYYDFKQESRKFFLKPELPDPRVFNKIPSFEVEQIEGKVKGGLSKLKGILSDYVKPTLCDMLTMPFRDFELKIRKSFSLMGLAVKSYLGKDPSGDVLRYILDGGKNIPIFCQVYKNSSQIGDMEVKTFASDMRDQKIGSGVLITFGGLTMSAGSLAKEKKIQVITGDVFESLYL
ncbi:MAG: hypothetical protein COB02_00775 [Candidatus Cloacimonadota bacterium]|nr:MAG: hypothetical protein COB02_00775 [Candidatus Cloacimonadota bacterium]